MTKQIAAHFDGNTIVPDEPFELPAGQPLRVQIEVVDAAPSHPFAELLEIVIDDPDAPDDLASQHDHYLYGLPKR